jgi:drug/metabolite transporter (DMT)-like permease
MPLSVACRYRPSATEVVGERTLGQARTGVALVTASAVAYSTAGYFTRVIELDAWTMLLWRGFYAGLAILAFIGWQQRRHTVSSFSAISWAGIAVAFCSAFATIAYINALRLTSVAEALVISATAPFLTAGMAWVWHRDRTATSTLIASGVAFLGVVVTMNGATTQGHILGNLLALVVALCLSAMMVIIRQRQEISMLPATCLSAFLCSILVLPVAMPSSAQGSTMILLMLFGIAQFGLGLILLTLGNRMISASRTALISCLDVPLGALWVWLAFNEVPPIAACIGGMIILAAVVGDTLAARAPDERSA